ncbi:MAG: DUF5665 domain-containing protein [Clostridiales bacterium]|jgi:hypothetical protein|nr:DUF5665 domain-containing protein [Eubacteriales bacterium]MDH7565204.1 DUF5665 domain-containing protein [Clostridiales bacterium]
MFGKRRLLTRINKKLDEISVTMEKFKLVDYVYYLEHPRKMLLANFIGGLARGFGIAVGFTLLGAFIIYFLQIIVKWNLPVIGQFISEIVKIVQENISKTGGRIDG